MNRFFLHVLIVFPALLFAECANAFDVDGFHSGMSREQLSVEATSRGLEVKEGADGSWFIGKFADQRIDGVFSFCGESMNSYSRSIDFDVDYIPMLNSLIDKSGQPRRVRTTQNQWTGSGGGNIQNVGMLWYVNNDRITLSFNTEGRDGKGQLRYYRNATIMYHAKSRCTKEF
jgi:hypothetical protein